MTTERSFQGQDVKFWFSLPTVSYSLPTPITITSASIWASFWNLGSYIWNIQNILQNIFLLFFSLILRHLSEKKFENFPKKIHTAYDALNLSDVNLFTKGILATLMKSVIKFSIIRSFCVYFCSFFLLFLVLRGFENCWILSLCITKYEIKNSFTTSKYKVLKLNRRDFWLVHFHIFSYNVVLRPSSVTLKHIYLFVLKNKQKMFRLLPRTNISSILSS